MKGFKRENCLIKNYITGYIDSPSGDLKTLYPFVTRTVAKKDTLCGAESKFALIIGAKVGPTCTAKDTKR
jgi:hypothetical protein